MRILQQKLRKLVIIKNCKFAQPPISRHFTETKKINQHMKIVINSKKNMFLITFNYHNLLITSVSLLSGGYRPTFMEFIEI